MTPSRKWFASRITAVTGLLTMWATTGTWDTEETIALITLVSAAGLAYYLPNDAVDGAE